MIQVRLFNVLGQEVPNSEGSLFQKNIQPGERINVVAVIAGESGAKDVVVDVTGHQVVDRKMRVSYNFPGWESRAISQKGSDGDYSAIRCNLAGGLVMTIELQILWRGEFGTNTPYNKCVKAAVAPIDPARTTVKLVDDLPTKYAAAPPAPYVQPGTARDSINWNQAEDDNPVL